MIQYLVSNTMPINLATTGIVLSTLVFVIIVASTYTKKSRNQYVKLANMPLLED